MLPAWLAASHLLHPPAMLQWLLGATLSRLLLPLFLVLFPAKALVVIPLAFEQLLKVRLAVKLTLQCCIASQTEGTKWEHVIHFTTMALLQSKSKW